MHLLVIQGWQGKCFPEILSFYRQQCAIRGKSGGTNTSEENPSTTTKLAISKPRASKPQSENVTQFHTLSEIYLQFPKDTCPKADSRITVLI